VTLSPKQRAHLRSLAHHLKPILHVGKEGLSESAVAAVELAFNNRELLKLKVTDGAPLTAREVGDQIAERVDGAHHVQTIGRTVVLYRPDPEEPEIVLPD
jgi:RNA-binding protein